ncbi:MAG TPA: non-canonical purine NTP pyrophosphatase, partial [Chlamydiales bacterium]|nr:non-canonical purine NTP pyrophosphatase [Chlamydiales bacterium]
MKEIILASFNTHKIHELRQALKQLMPDLQVLSLFDFPAYKRPGVSFEENVGMKALHAAKALQKTCIADDSKIVIPALEKAGAPLAKINIITSSPNEQESLAKQTKKLLEAMRSF